MVNQQKGKKCSVPECTEHCVSNNLCAKHNMALWRYGDVYGKKSNQKVCKNPACHKLFSSKHDRALYCDPGCRRRSKSVKKNNQEAVRRWRERHPGAGGVHDSF